MDREKRGTIAFIIIIILVILLSVIYFFWGVINKGKITISGEAPFSVQVFETGETVTCEGTPCEIETKGGIKNLIIQKEDHRSILTEVDVKILRTVELNLEFQALPSMSSAAEIPVPQNVEYALVQEGTDLQKLILADDLSERPIVYFEKTLSEDTQIFANENYAMIIARGRTVDIYKINIDKKSRDKISLNIPVIDSAKLSPNGNYLIFKSGEIISILDFENAKVSSLALRGNISQMAWLYDDTLAFVTDQTFRSETGVGERGFDQVQFFLDNAKSELGYTFGFYYPLSDTYTRIDTFSEISEMPEEIVPSSNASTIYFKSGEETFQIILGKF